MRIFKFLSLRSRFLIAPLMGIILTLILFFSSNSIIRSNSNLFQYLSESNLPQVSEISRMTVLLINNHIDLTNLLLSTSIDPDEERVYLEGRNILTHLRDI